MLRIQLFFNSISEIIGSDGLSVVLLVDASQQRTLTVVCDKAMTTQISMRINKMPGCNTFLPEVLWEMMLSSGHDIKDFELQIYDVKDGQYMVILLNKSTTLKHIRMSDAILLNYFSHIPLYIERELFERQASPIPTAQTGISIPINTIDTDQLNRELEKAISEENYRLASHLHEELKKRKKK